MLPQLHQTVYQRYTVVPRPLNLHHLFKRYSNLNMLRIILSAPKSYKNTCKESELKNVFFFSTAILTRIKLQIKFDSGSIASVSSTQTIETKTVNSKLFQKIVLLYHDQTKHLLQNYRTASERKTLSA